MNSKQTAYQERKFDNRNRLYFVIATIFILVLIISGATSCITQKQVDKICQSGKCPTKEVIKHDTIIEKITEYVKTDPLLDSLLFVSSWNPEKITDTVYIEDSHWKGLFYISTGKLTAQINYLSDSLLMLKQSTISSVNASEVKTITKNVYIDKPIRDKWYKFYCRFTWISIALVLVLIAFWCLWKYGQLQLRWRVFKNRF